MRGVISTFESYVKLTKNIPADILNSVTGNPEPLLLADTVVAHLNLKISDKQELLATRDAG